MSLRKGRVRVAHSTDTDILRRLEPLGVLVFSVIMITSFVQVALEAVQRLASPDRQIVELYV